MSSPSAASDSSDFIQVTSSDVPLTLSPTQLQITQLRYPNAAERQAYKLLYNHRIALCCSTKPLDQRLYQAVETLLESLDMKTDEVKRLRQERDDAREEWKEMQQDCENLERELREKEGELEAVDHELGKAEEELKMMEAMDEKNEERGVGEKRRRT